MALLAVTNVNPPVDVFLKVVKKLFCGAQGLMEIWSNVSGNDCDSGRNSCRSDTTVHRRRPLLLPTTGKYKNVRFWDDSHNFLNIKLDFFFF